MENPDRDYNDHDDQQLDDQQDNLHPQQTFQGDYQQKPQQELENIIMEEVLKIQKKQDNISQELQDKLNTLLDKVHRKNQQEVLNIRMHQLAICKILVFTHGKSQFRLVQAHFHIGQAYLNYKCYQQAIDHLTVALKKNTKLNEIKQTKLYHSYMLTTLSQCYYQIASYQDALQVLNRAYDIQKDCTDGDSVINNVQTLLLISNCYFKLKKYKESIQFIQRATQIISKIKGQNSKQFAMAKVQLSKIHAMQQNGLQKAIDDLNNSIELLNSINYNKKQQLAQLYQTLAQYYQKFGDIQKHLQALRNKYNIYQQQYGYSDKRTIKVKRNVAIALLKHQKFNDSLNQLQEILEIQEKVYGENSSQVGKTLKIIGTIYINNNQNNQAEQYLKRAQKILHDQGHPKLVREIKTKLTYIKQLKQGNKMKQIDINS